MINDLLQMRVRFLRQAKRQMVYFKNRLLRILRPLTKMENRLDGERKLINVGDTVKVRSREEIWSLLDDHNRYKGCLFIDEMYQHCSNTYKVLKKVCYFFDEAKQKVCKCEEMVILEGVLCSGWQRLYSVSCDRNCFFFWHAEWLQAVG